MSNKLSSFITRSQTNKAVHELWAATVSSALKLEQVRVPLAFTNESRGYLSDEEKNKLDKSVQQYLEAKQRVIETAKAHQLDLADFTIYDILAVYRQ